MKFPAETKSHQWVLYALLAMCCASIYTLLIKVSGPQFAPMQFLCGVFVFQIIFLAAVALVQGKIRKIFFGQSLRNIILCLICGVVGALGNIGEVYAIETSPNIGYVSAIKLGQILIVTLLGDWVSRRRASTKLVDLLWSGGVVGGLLFVTLGGIGGASQQTDRWLFYAFGAMFSFSVMTLLTRFISNSMEAYALTFWIISCAGLCIALYSFSDFRMLLHVPDHSGYLLLVAAGIAVGIFNLMFTKSITVAPNPGFTISINALQMPLITIAGLLLFQDQTISITAVFGGVIALISVIRIAVANKGDR